MSPPPLLSQQTRTSFKASEAGHLNLLAANEDTIGHVHSALHPHKAIPIDHQLAVCDLAPHPTHLPHRTDPSIPARLVACTVYVDGDVVDVSQTMPSSCLSALSLKGEIPSRRVGYTEEKYETGCPCSWSLGRKLSVKVGHQRGCERRS